MKGCEQMPPMYSSKLENCKLSASFKYDQSEEKMQLLKTICILCVLRYRELCLLLTFTSLQKIIFVLLTLLGLKNYSSAVFARFCPAYFPLWHHCIFSVEEY
jgi:hypothetical protein